MCRGLGDKPPPTSPSHSTGVISETDRVPALHGFSDHTCRVARLTCGVRLNLRRPTPESGERTNHPCPFARLRRVCRGLGDKPPPMSPSHSTGVISETDRVPALHGFSDHTCRVARLSQRRAAEPALARA